MEEHYISHIVIIILLQTLLIVAVSAVVYSIIVLKRKLTDMHIRLLDTQREQEKQYKYLLDQIKQQSDKPHALDELQYIFGYKISRIRDQYPALTDTDMQVLLLLGIGVENHEIMTMTNMSKRTYYRRRQVLAQRMGTTAAKLDVEAGKLFEV